MDSKEKQEVYALRAEVRRLKRRLKAFGGDDYDATKEMKCGVCHGTGSDERGDFCRACRGSGKLNVKGARR